MITPESKSPSISRRFWVKVDVHTYICIRGRLPSAGVPKFALFTPLPSWASARTESLPAPPRP
jgi:hypothetical protein